ncbi:MAG: hypothetical protein ACJAZJ_000353 [Candidatus Endobugula sp.]|jgi:hypothetical protein
MTTARALRITSPSAFVPLGTYLPQLYNISGLNIQPTHSLDPRSARLVTLAAPGFRY